MFYTDLKTNPYFTLSTDENGNETFYPVSSYLPNGLEEHHIHL